MTSPGNQLIHSPVMVTETITFLKVRPEGVYVDGTVGLGGHAKEILSRVTSGRIIGIDRDEEALAVMRKEFQASLSPISIHHGSYAELPTILQSEGLDMVDGIVLDLGLSSLQLDSRSRGFSYKYDSPLDMRFDKSSGLTAADLISELSESDLADIIYKWGEERHSRKIARSIKSRPRMETISDLNDSIRIVTAPQHRNRTLARVYQALRIEVNQELEQLRLFLDLFHTVLKPGGRVVIISFHSLEDRMVKQAFKKYNSEGILTILNKRPLTASEKEQKNNRRSRSAKLRAAERVSA